MFRAIKQYAPFDGVAANALATASIPADGRHFTYYLRFLTSGGALVTLAQMINDATLIRIKVDGETFIEGSAEFLYKLSDYYYAQAGAAATNVAGQLAINLSRDYLADPVAAEVFAWGTADINNITMEIQLASSITTAQIDVRVERSDEIMKLGDHVKILRFPQSHASATEDSINDIPKDPNSAHLAYHIMYDDNTANLLTGILTVDGTDVVTTTTDIVRTTCNKAKRTIQTNASGNSIFPFDLGLVNDLRGGLPMMNGATKKILQDLRIRPIFSGAAPGNYTLFLEQISRRV